MQKTKVLLVLVVLLVLLVACDSSQQAKTEYFIAPGQSVIFEHVCDYENGMGVWFLVRTYDASSDTGMAIALSFQMSNEDYLDKCQPG